MDIITAREYVCITNKFITHKELSNDYDFLFVRDGIVYSKKRNHINKFNDFTFNKHTDYKRKSIFDNGWEEIVLDGWDLIFHNMHCHFHFENPITMSIGYSGGMIESYLKDNLTL